MIALDSSNSYDYDKNEFIKNIKEILKEAISVCIEYGEKRIDVNLDYRIRFKPLVLRIVLTCKDAGMLKILNTWFNIYTKSFIPIREGKEPKSRPEISLSFKELEDLKEMKKLLESIEDMIKMIIDTIRRIYEDMFPVSMS